MTIDCLSISKRCRYAVNNHMGKLVALSKSSVAVLVVEDDPLLLLVAVFFLEEAGYRVYEAKNAVDAIELLELNEDIRVIFTDVDMPGTMDGLTLAHVVRDRWPPVQIIVTSGHQHIKHSDLPERGVFFSKPYHNGEIISQIGRMVA